MANRQTCADTLLLLGEMLDTASRNIGLCDEEKDGEDSLMMDLAANHKSLLPVVLHEQEQHGLDGPKFGKRFLNRNCANNWQVA
jgi:hypothetical protein